MTTKDAIDMMEIAVRFAHLEPKISAYRVACNVAKLSRLGSEAHTWAERLCNYGEPSEGADERKRESIRRRAMACMADMTITGAVERIEMHGDPRGSCLQLILTFTKSGKLFSAEIRF